MRSAPSSASACATTRRRSPSAASPWPSSASTRAPASSSGAPPARAHEAAERARVPALLAEVAEARAALDRPAARRVHAGHDQPLRLDEVEALLASGALVVDACRRGLRAGTTWRPLARRPVLFALARALAEAWPGDVQPSETRTAECPVPGWSRR
jgi:hypothetical protein